MIAPITTPKPLLAGFVTFTTQAEINRVDGSRLHETEKFRELAGPTAFFHIHQAFAFKLPPQLVLIVQDLGLPITVTGEVDGMIVEGIMSASLATWRKFLVAANLPKADDWLLKLAKVMYDSYFRHYPYFMDI